MKHDKYTFKSTTSTVQVWDDGDAIAVHVESEAGQKCTGYLSKFDAPAIALAILRAAGHAPLETGGFHAVGTFGHLGAIAQELADCIAYTEDLSQAEQRDESQS